MQPQSKVRLMLFARRWEFRTTEMRSDHSPVVIAKSIGMEVEATQQRLRSRHSMYFSIAVVHSSLRQALDYLKRPSQAVPREVLQPLSLIQHMRQRSRRLVGCVYLHQLEATSLMRCFLCLDRTATYQPRSLALVQSSRMLTNQTEVDPVQNKETVARVRLLNSSA